MAIVSVRAKNFCQFKSVDLRLKKLGLVWIGGENHDTSGATSNGAGKSNFAKLLGWVPYGRAVDKKDRDDVIRDGEKATWTEMVLDDGWRIVRERRPGAPKLQLFHGEEPVVLPADEYQARIDELMGRNWRTFRNTAFFGQRDAARFISPDTDDAERKEILHDILNSNVYGGAHEWVKQEALKWKKKADEFQALAERAIARLHEHDLSALEAKRDEWERQRRARIAAEVERGKNFLGYAQRLADERPDVAALEQRLTDLAWLNETAAKVEAALVSLEADAHKADLVVAEAKGGLASAERDRRRAEAARRQFSGDHCPTCGSSLKAGPGETLVAHLDGELETTTAAFEQAQKVVEDARARAKAAAAAVFTEREQIRLIQSKIRRLNGVEREIELAKRKDAEISNAKQSAKDAVLRAQKIRDEANPFDEQLDDVRERIHAAESARDAAQERLAEVEAERPYWDWWTRGMGPSGLPSFALDSVMPLITERTNHYLETLADGDITVCFSTQRELKSAKGEFRDKIGFSWEIEGVANKQPSGGQWKKLEISTDFALMDLVATMARSKGGLLVLDEVFDGLDPEGVDRMGHLLQRMRAEHDSIFVISHAPTMQEFFEKALIVRKRRGVSELVAA